MDFTMLGQLYLQLSLSINKQNSNEVHITAVMSETRC